MLEINEIVYHSNFKVVKEVKIDGNKYLKNLWCNFAEKT